MTPHLSSTHPLGSLHDLPGTLSALATGQSDPCWRREGDGSWLWATRTPEGPATLRVAARDDGVAADAWGGGARWVLDRVPALLGRDDDPSSFVPGHPAVADLLARFPGVRMGATGRVVDAAIAGICRRGVSGFEAGRSWSLMVEAMGDDAPGPGGLRLPPAPRRVAAAEPYDLHVLGLEQGRADEVRRVASHATRLEEGADGDLDVAIDRLGTIAGLGEDAIEHARSVALGDADAVPVVDAHHVAVLASLVGPGVGERQAVEELLEPFRPHRGRVLRLVALVDGSAAGAGVSP